MLQIFMVKGGIYLRRLRVLIFWFCLVCSSANLAAEESIVEKGKYLFQAAGGCGCHTDTKNDGTSRRILKAESETGVMRISSGR